MGKNCSVDAGKFQHNSLGTIELISQRVSNYPRVRLSRLVKSLKEFTEWDREIRVYMQQDFKEVFYLPEQYKFVAQGLCGNGGRIQMEFEYYKYSLKSEITSRYQSMTRFDQTELWYLLYNILQAAFLLEPLSRRIGDLHPTQIVLNEKGRIKIIPYVLFPNTKSSYQKIVEDIKSDVFLAPEEIDHDLIDRGVYPPVDALKAEVFSIGATLLMAACLRDSSYLYDRKVLKFNSGKKQQCMQGVSQQYSQYFCSILSSLLEEDPNKRRTSGDFFRELNKYQEDILSLKKFEQMEANINKAFQQVDESMEPSIADILNMAQRKGSHISPQASIINNFHSF